MLIPQFSLRTLLALTVLAALVAWVLSQAAAGATWAQCTGYTLVFVVVLFLAYGGLFLAAWTTGKLLGIVTPTHAAHPFAPASPFATSGSAPVNPFAATPSDVPSPSSVSSPSASSPS
jgi:hypothetical protein